MTGMADIRPLSLDQTDIQPLADEAWAEGYAFVERMLEDWKSGEYRFDGPGEQLLGAFDGDRIIGFCGLGRDPFVEGPVGRLRHLYVSRPYRGCGIAKELVAGTLEGAEVHFPRVRLRSTPAAVAFYEHLGFRPVEEPAATHSLSLE